MSRLRRDIARRKLNDLLSVADDEQFLKMIWAADALQSGRADSASRFIKYNPGTETARLGDKGYALKWLMETLVNELFCVRKKTLNPGELNTRLDCGHFASLATCINALHRLEEAEDAIKLKTINVLSMMPKLAQRQFEWQRGFFSESQIYRAMFVFGGEHASDYFSNTHQVSQVDFINVGFVTYALVQDHPGFVRSLDLKSVNLTDQARERTLTLIGLPIADIRAESVKLRDPSLGPAYQRSVLRQRPLIFFGDDNDRIFAPLPALILQRITTGLYYDLVKGGPKIWREIGERFEEYSFELITVMLPNFTTERSFKYQTTKNFDAPDVLLKRSGVIEAVFECKAKKMTFEAKFSDNPLQDAAKGYSEIVQGIVQLWRFFSHCRRGILNETLAQSVVGVLLTLDPWLDMSDLRQRILIEADKAALLDDPEILDIDKKPIVFSSISDLENVFENASQENVLNTLRWAAEDRFLGWYLHNVHQHCTDGEGVGNPYPFAHRISELNPSWSFWSGNPDRRS